MSLFRAPTNFRRELLDAAKLGKTLLDCVFRTKAACCTPLPKWWRGLDPRYVYEKQAQLSREYFLSEEFLCLKAWEPAPVVKVWLAVQEATRSEEVSEWDGEKIERAVSEFHQTWQTADFASRVQREPGALPESSEAERLPKRLEKVRLACVIAVASLSKEKREEEITKKDVWEWIKEHAPSGYVPPGFATWERYLRDIPPVFSNQKRFSATLGDIRTLSGQFGSPKRSEPGESRCGQLTFRWAIL